MSEESVEMTLRLIDAWNRRDVEAAVALSDPEALWFPPLEGITEGRTYRGHDEIRQYYEDLAEFSEESHGEYAELHDLGDRVLALGRIRIKFAGGVDLNDEVAGLYTWRDGRCVEARAWIGHAARADAFEAAGLPEEGITRANVEIVRQAYEAFNRGDMDGAVANLSPEFEYVATGAIPGMEGVVRAPEGFRGFLESWWGEFDEPRVEIHELIETGDQVVASLTFRGRGKQSGVETTWDIWQAWTIRHGKAVRGRGFMRREEALEAAGLRE